MRSIRSKEKRFLAIFVPAFFVPYLFLTCFLDLRFLNEMVAAAGAGVLNSFGCNAASYGDVVSLGGGNFRIVAECTGVIMVLLFASLVFATGVSKKSAFKALAAGIPFLFAFNLLRLALTIVAGVWLGSTAPVHQTLWFLDGGVVLVAWYAAFKYDRIK